MKRIVVALAALSFATPTQALTWKEFWEPFTSEHYRSYDRGYYYNEHDGCYRVDYDYHYEIPGYYNGRRWVPRTTKWERRSKWVNCHRQYKRYYSPHHHHH